MVFFFLDGTIFTCVLWPRRGSNPQLSGYPDRESDALATVPREPISFLLGDFKIGTIPGKNLLFCVNFIKDMSTSCVLYLPHVSRVSFQMKGGGYSSCCFW